MGTRGHKLLDLAMDLPEDQRAELAARLIESLDGKPDADVEAAWSAEIKRRLGELDSGDIEPVAWLEARRRIFGD